MSDLVYLSDVAPYRHPGQPVQLAGVHRSLTTAARACREIASVNGLGFRQTASAEELSPAILGTARVLVLFTIGETPWTEEQCHLIESRLADGTMGMLALHSASDSAYGWAHFGQLVGPALRATQSRAPCLSRSLAQCTRPRGTSPHLGGSEKSYTCSAPSSRTPPFCSLSIPRSSRKNKVPGWPRSPAALGESGPKALLPMAWCIERGAMRTFYTVLGHFHEAYEDQRYLEHLSGAVRWILGANR